MSLSNTGDNYKFEAPPQVVRNKNRYRPNQTPIQQKSRYQYQNLMFEKRVVRGNTHSTYMAGRSEVEEAPISRNVVRRGKNTTMNDTYNSTDKEMNNTTEFRPPMGANYDFIEACTDEYVETETDLPPCHEATTQTEYQIPKIIPDLSMPVYTGIHKETQIYPGESLFDFDYECEPISQVILSKVLEESQIEVVEEEELAAMKKKQEKLKRQAEKTARKLQALEDQEREKTRKNLEFLKDRKAKKADQVDVHQHLISKVYAKRYLADVTRASLDILDNMCAFMDEEEKKTKDEFLPWLFDETLANLNAYKTNQGVIDRCIDDLNKDFVGIHKDAVSVEFARKKAIQDEADRIQAEREERRRKKLEFKLKRREDRRLYYLESELFEKFINSAEIDNEIVNICDIDGTDSNGSKAIGFKGGLVGELYKFVSYLKTHEMFKEHEIDPETIGDLVDRVFSQFVEPGWTIMVGLKQEFEANYRHVVGEFEISEFDLDYVRSIDDEEEYNEAINFVVRHFVSQYMEKQMPELKAIQEKYLEEMRPPPQAEEGEGEEEEGEQKDGEEEEENREDGEGEEEENKENEIEKVEGDENSKPEDANEGEGTEEEATQEPSVPLTEGEKKAYDFLSFLKIFVTRIFDTNSGKYLKSNLIQASNPPMSNSTQLGSSKISLLLQTRRRILRKITNQRKRRQASLKTLLLWHSACLSQNPKYLKLKKPKKKRAKVKARKSRQKRKKTLLRNRKAKKRTVRDLKKR